MKTTEKQAIAARLKEYCENKGSQNKAAATLKGVSPATLSQLSLIHISEPTRPY